VMRTADHRQQLGGGGERSREGKTQMGNGLHPLTVEAGSKRAA
jgi:hypothetical protein